MKLLKILGIGILIFCVIAIIEPAKEYISLYQIYIDSGSSSGGGTYVPPSIKPPEDTNTGTEGQEPESPPDISYKGVFHKTEHPYHHFEPIMCNGCGKIFTEYSSLAVEDIYHDSFISKYKFNRGLSTKLKCPECGSTDGNFRDILSEYHCYVDGVCHDCGKQCEHYIYYSGGYDFEYLLEELSLYAPNHPLISSGLTFECGQGCIVDGTCMVCLLSDYDDNVISYKDDNGFILTKFASLDGYCVTGYLGSETVITVPSEFNDKPVVRICNEAFKNRSVMSITVPDNVYIEDNAFSGCQPLVEIIINREKNDDDTTRAPWGAPENLGLIIYFEIPAPVITSRDELLESYDFVCDCGTHHLDAEISNCKTVLYLIGDWEIYPYGGEFAYNVVCKTCGALCDKYIFISENSMWT